jgi:hypothetical protein
MRAGAAAGAAQGSTLAAPPTSHCRSPPTPPCPAPLLPPLLPPRSTILPIPFALSRTGVLVGGLTMLVVAAANDLTSCWLIRAAALTGHASYEALAEWAGGWRWKVGAWLWGRGGGRGQAGAGRVGGWRWKVGGCL